MSKKKTFIVQYQANVTTGNRVFSKIKKLTLKDGLDPNMIVSDLQFKGFIVDGDGLIHHVPEGKEKELLPHVQPQEN